MRAHMVLNYRSILQVLGEAACPFCRLANFQTALLQEPEKEVYHHCNLRILRLAATQQAASAAERFMSLLQEDLRGFQVLLVPSAPCCKRKKIFESASLSATPGTSSSHNGYNLRRLSAWFTERSSNPARPRALSPESRPFMEKCRRQLVEDFARLHNEYLPNAERWAGMGRAAGFMVSQRGLHA